MTFRLSFFSLSIYWHFITQLQLQLMDDLFLCSNELHGGLPDQLHLLYRLYLVIRNPHSMENVSRSSLTLLNKLNIWFILKHGMVASERVSPSSHNNIFFITLELPILSWTTGTILFDSSDVMVEGIFSNW